MKKILVVEDDEVERELVRMTLEREGYRVVTAEDGERGFEMALAERPDLIVTDVSMPASDGIQLVRRVRSAPEVAATPILVTTGFGTGNATFTLMQEYRGGRVPLIHVDLYRLNDAREIDELGLEELGLDSVLAIEWAEKLPRPIADAVEVRIDHGDGDERRLTITPSGSSALPS